MLRPLVIAFLLLVAMAAAPGCSSRHDQATHDAHPAVVAHR